jgi:hypothetical protein
MWYILRLIEDEHCFNILFFMKGKLHNHLIVHFELCRNVFTR